MLNISSHKKLIRITTVPLALHSLLPGQMKFMQENGFEVILISADGPELKNVIENEQCRHIIVPMTRQITPLQDLKCLLQLIKFFRKEKPDIVHSHTPKAGLLGMVAAKICGVKIRIHTVAGLPLMVEKGIKFHLLKFIERFTYCAASKVWPNSNSLFRYIQENKLTSGKKLKIIGKGSSNGINIKRYNPSAINENIFEEIKQTIRYSPQNKYLLCVGRLVKDKGIIELVEVFTAVQKKYPFLKLVLAGSYEDKLDPLPSAIMEQITANPGIIHISWTDKVEYYMHVADYFVFPSHREGFPNVLLQAGTMQLPIICSHIAGNVDIVEHNVTGLLFETANKDEMLQLISYAINNPLIMKTMAEKLADNIRQNYSQENFWNIVLAQYHSLLNNA